MTLVFARRARARELCTLWESVQWLPACLRAERWRKPQLQSAVRIRQIKIP